ncbi:MAG TPA: hypothetical protein PLB45_02075 [Bacilli bacterium]|nr:hypothetical protein [Bacilli bacterium]
MEYNEGQLGIPNYGPWYIDALPTQDKIQEMNRIHSFINAVIYLDDIKEFKGRKDIEFINYGSNQLIYVLTINGISRYTLVVNQPSMKPHSGELEFNNLRDLSKTNSNVIQPLYYFVDERNPSLELYITKYEYQSRCIGVDTTKWGMWIPEPYYHFLNFHDIEKNVVASNMIALLIKFYDENKNLGIVNCKLDGGDFMLKKSYLGAGFTNDNILNNLELIASRKRITISLDEYINMLINELTILTNEHIFLLRQLRTRITDDEVYKGVDIGLKLRKINR